MADSAGTATDSAGKAIHSQLAEVHWVVVGATALDEKEEAVVSEGRQDPLESCAGIAKHWAQ